MVGMKIKMNEEKIINDGIYDLEKLYKYINKCMVDNHLIIGKVNKDGTRMYWGPNSKYDMANFGLVVCELERTDWFLDNCLVWMWGDNDENPKDWDWEDVLVQALNNRKDTANGKI